MSLLHVEPQHICKEAGYKSELKILWFKEPIDDFNWNLVYYDEPKSSIAFHINFCPFCGIKLDKDE